MNVTLSRDTLAAALERIAPALPRKPIVPIYGHLRGVADERSLTVTATDGDMEIAVTLDAAVTTPGALCIEGEKMIRLVKSLASGADVRIETAADGRAKLSSGRVRATLESLPVADFPIMSAADTPYRATLPAERLTYLIRRTRFATESDMVTRAFLCGINIQADDAANRLVAEASDGHRGSVAAIDLPDGMRGCQPVIVPNYAIDAIAKLIAKLSGDVELALGRTRVVVRVTELPVNPAAVATITSFASKVIDGTFPDIARFIPQPVAEPVEIEIERLRAAIDCAMIAADEVGERTGNGVRLSLTAGIDEVATITVSGWRAQAAGQATIAAELEVGYRGQAMEIGFNGRLLQSLLSAADGDRVLLHLKDPVSPARMTDLTPRDGDVMILMPARLNKSNPL